jgi:CO/xanthine dehydrogenase Mo-binding subunit
MNAHRIIGKDIPRADGRAKATGQAVYADDIKLPACSMENCSEAPCPTPGF